MSVYTMSLSKFREAFSLAVNNTLEYPEMVEAVVPYGYTVEVLEAAQADLTTFTEAKSDKHARYGLQKAATKALGEARKTFHAKVYMRHVRIARAVFRNDPDIQATLGIRGRREQAFDRWISQVLRFYTQALDRDDIKTRLGERSLTEEMLIEGRNIALSIEKKFQKRANKRGLAQQSTRNRDDIRDELNDWLADYYHFAREAFADNPEWLERIGLLHRST